MVKSIQKNTGGKRQFTTMFITWILRIIYSCDINLDADIDKTVKFSHCALGVVIHGKASIGAGTQIEVNTVIGQTHDGKVPKIGRNCLIGANSVLVGSIVLGDNVKVGAGAVVVQNVPSNCTVVGVPAKVIYSCDECR